MAKISKKEKAALTKMWKPRIEGQIKFTMHCHPEWFSNIPKDHKGSFVTSLSKRIIGEIIAMTTNNCSNNT